MLRPVRKPAPPAPASRLRPTGLWPVLSPAVGVFLVLLLFSARGGEAASSFERLSLSIRPVALEVQKPVAITHAGDGSGFLYVTLQPGRVLKLDPASGQVRPFLDITSRVGYGGERGLLSVAFHPRYAKNGYFFVNYTDTGGATVVARYSRPPGGGMADADKETRILEIAQPYANHNGGQLQFGPDGMLYIGMGDGGSGRDPENRAQNLAELHGKMLRIDVDGPAPYAIPPDNPFLKQEGARPEIWALGLRNPWRFSFDKETGDLFIGDVGQANREEIDFQPRASAGGENYGWKIREGRGCLESGSASRLKQFFSLETGSSCSSAGLTEPILEYAHDGGHCAVVGGYRYRGKKSEALAGVYLYGDYCSGRIWGAVPGDGGAWVARELIDTALSITAFGEGEDGELYVAHGKWGGEGAIYRILAGP